MPLLAAVLLDRRRLRGRRHHRQRRGDALPAAHRRPAARRRAEGPARRPVRHHRAERRPRAAQPARRRRQRQLRPDARWSPARTRCGSGTPARTTSGWRCSARSASPTWSATAPTCGPGRARTRPPPTDTVPACPRPRRARHPAPASPDDARSRPPTRRSRRSRRPRRSAPTVPRWWPAGRRTSCVLRAARQPAPWSARCGSRSTARPTSRPASRCSRRAPAKPAFEVGFTSFDPTARRPRSSAFNPPPGHQGDRGADPPSRSEATPGTATPAGRPAASADSRRSSGTGWTSVVGRDACPSADGSRRRVGAGPLGRVLKALPEGQRQLGLGTPAPGHALLRRAHRRRPGGRRRRRAGPALRRPGRAR